MSLRVVNEGTDMAAQRDKIVGIDIDGVLADYVGALRPLAVEHEGFTLPEGQPTTFGMVEPGWLTESAQWLRLHQRWTSGHVDKTPVLDRDAAKTLSVIREQGHTVVMITSRSAEPTDTEPELVKEHTAAWLERHEFAHDELVFTADKSAVEWDVLIDDSPRHLAALSSLGRGVWVRDHPYNRTPDLAHLPRAHSITDFAHQAGLLG